MSDFYEDHGYIQGTYEGKLTSQGYNLADVKAQVGAWGNNMNPGEYQKIISKLGPSPLQQQRDTALGNMQSIASQEYAFDPNKYLPGIQQQADAIYAPQQAQLEAIRLLQQSQYEDQRITTNKDFNDQMQSEIESINNRGAYFSGGAVQREQDVGDAKLRALNQLGLQAQAADFNNLAQQGLLEAEESQFIQDRLYNAESSAYARWTDQRNFSFQAAVQQYQIYADERNYVRGVFESDRTFNESVRQFEANYDLQTQQMDMQQKQFEQTYSINQAQFDMAKEQFNIDIQKSQLSLDQAMTNFKQSTAVTNTGALGVSASGNDIYDSLGAEWSDLSNTGTGTSGGPMSTNDGGILDLNDPSTWNF